MSQKKRVAHNIAKRNGGDLALGRREEKAVEEYGCDEKVIEVCIGSYY